MSLEISSKQNLSNHITAEQLEQIIKSILSGKYSWACVLFLYFCGYNPMDYMPYRTYIRLLKNNCLIGKNSPNKNEQNNLELVDISSGWMHLGIKREQGTGNRE